MANDHRNSTMEIAETASELCAGRHADEARRPDVTACNEVLELAYTQAECRQITKRRP